MLRYRCLVSLLALVSLMRPGRHARLTTGAAEDGSPHIWLHGASNGELSSARPIIETLHAARPDLAWLITCNTETAREMVAKWHLPRVSVRLAPLDLAWLSRKVIKRWNVQDHIALEAEIWPHRVLSCPGTTLLLGARMSDGTARGWSTFGALSRQVLAQVNYASAQDANSLQNLQKLGLREGAVGSVFDLKSLYRAPDVPPDPALNAIVRSSSWLAASTHTGEEETVIAAHQIALQTAPDLRLVLAPRHPRRGDEIEALLQTSGLSVARRSRGDPPSDAQVYLADTMGEMALWYRACGRVFVAGSLTNRGGHTPYEPAAFGAALIHGPDTRNFRAAYARLRDAHAAREITDASTLAQALSDLRAPDAQETAGQAAKAALRQDLDAQSLCTSLLSHLTPSTNA